MNDVSPLGPLPPGWRLAHLGDLSVKIGSGATPTGGEKVYLPSRRRFALIRSQCVHDREFDLSALSFISDDDAARLRSASVQPGDVLLNITGDGVTFSRASLAPPDALPACVNQHVAIIRPNRERLVSGFLLSYLTHPLVKNYIESFNAGGSRRAITKGHIERFLVPLPSLGEQTAIATLLSVLDDKIELNRRMNETLEAMAQAIFRDWFVDFGPTLAKMESWRPYLGSGLWRLFPETVDSEGKPLGWEWVKASEIIAFNPTERIPSGTVSPYLDMAALPTVGSWPDTPVTRAYASGSRFRNGDALLARITPCLENGKAAFIQCLEDNVIAGGSTEFIVMRARPPLPSAFPYLLARYSEFKEHAIRSMTGTSGRQRVQVDTLAAFPVIKPTKPVAEAFGNLVEPWFERIACNARESETLSALRDLLLPKLMSGEVRIKEAENLMAEVA